MICIIAIPAVAAAGYSEISRPVHSTGAAIADGLPRAVAASIRPNPRLNMNAWACSTPSISHSEARQSCCPRRSADCAGLAAAPASVPAPRTADTTTASPGAVTAVRPLRPAACRAGFNPATHE